MQRFFIWLKDLLFPKFCVDCKKEGDWLCEVCLKNLLKTKSLFHQKDKVGLYLDGVTALFIYGDNTISKLIQIFKYNFLLEIVVELRKIILATDLSFDFKDFIIIPVPLHPRRYRERGFNQAEIIADLFTEKLGLEINKNLQRSVYTKQQAKLSGEARQLNLADAFIFETKNGSVPEKVLLIDDVFTTGTTMNECAKALKNKGVKVVWGMALAKGQ